MVEFETTVLRNLLNNDEFTRQAIPFLKPEYFEESHRFIFSEIAKFVGKYNKLPTEEAFMIDLSDAINGSVDSGEVSSIVNEIFIPREIDLGWILDHTEKWCQDRAIFLAVMESITIIDGKHDSLSPNALPELLSKALAVSFNRSIGHHYINDSETRFDSYHAVESKMPFDIEMLNTITKGGVPRKSLNCWLASTGVGKSLVMCHQSAAALTAGRNVLYITMEMAEERIAERIDANLMNVELDNLGDLSREMYNTKIKKISDKTKGQLIIKEYPTGSAHAGHFRALLDDLKLKKNFTPNVIFIDYINICASSRMAGLSGNVNTYSLVKSIAEELRGLAVEQNVPIFTATQSNRSALNNSDMDLDNVSESFGLPATVDFMAAIISTEELEKLGQIMFKQLKNRYSDNNVNKRFVVGINRAKMKLYDVEDSAQSLVQGGSPPPADGAFNRFGSSEKKDFTAFKM